LAGPRAAPTPRPRPTPRGPRGGSTRFTAPTVPRRRARADGGHWVSPDGRVAIIWSRATQEAMRTYAAAVQSAKQRVSPKAKSTITHGHPVRSIAPRRRVVVVGRPRPAAP